MAKIIKKEDYKLRNTWRLYYHSVTNDSWDDESYIKLPIDIDSISKFNKVINNIGNFTSGMFFLMKEDIFPTYEDPNNSDGGYWSFRISKKNINHIWENVIAAAVGQTLTKKVEDMSQINGITISPKINNCILKIWNLDNEKDNPEILSEDIGLDIKDAKYQSHRTNIERSKKYRK